MLKDLNKEKGGKSGKKKEQHSKLMEKDVPVPETDNVEEDINLHCVDRTVRELEFIMVRRKLMRSGKREGVRGHNNINENFLLNIISVFLISFLLFMVRRSSTLLMYFLHFLKFRDIL